MKSGFAALIGRPNVGKSTLLNRLLGEKLAIVSPKPQTTRSRIMGVVTTSEGQIAFYDTPGIHQAQGALNKFMVNTAVTAAEDSDVVLMMIDAEGLREDRKPQVSPGNRVVIDRLAQLAKPTILVINKIDTIKKVLMLPLIDVYRREFAFLEVMPVSAERGTGIDELLQAIFRHLPESEPLFPADTFTDQSERDLVAEFIREQVLRHCRHEIPYSAAVVIDEFDESDRKDEGIAQPKKKASTKQRAYSGLVRITASIFVERESQKAIVIGKQGQMLKQIGTDGRSQIERLLRSNVFLSLQVKVEPRWSERNDGLKKLGYRFNRS